MPKKQRQYQNNNIKNLKDKYASLVQGINSAAILSNKNNHDAAIKKYNENLAVLSKTLKEIQPSDSYYAQFQRLLAITLCQLGTCYSACQQFDNAIKVFLGSLDF